jgi:hypothetical protein
MLLIHLSYRDQQKPEVNIFMYDFISKKNENENFTSTSALNPTFEPFSNVCLMT